MNFPQWAPEELCELYSKFEKSGWRQLEEGEDVPEDQWCATYHAPLYGEIKALMERMLTDRDMEPVWEAWSKLSPDEEDKKYYGMSETTKGYWLLFTDMIMILEIPYFKVTRNESIHILREIATLSKKLSMAVRYERELSCSSMDVLIDNPFDAVDLDKQLKAVFGDDYMSEILSRMAKQARSTARAIEERHPAYDHHFLSRPRAKKASANCFIRSMSLVFESRFRSPRPRLLARLSRVVLDDPEIDENFIKSCLQEWRKNKVNGEGRR